MRPYQSELPIAGGPSERPPQPGDHWAAAEHPGSGSQIGAELDRLGFTAAGHLAIDLVDRYLRTLPDQPVFRPMTPQQRELLRGQPLPEQGVAASELLDTFERDIAPFAMGNGHPRFFGWVNSPPAPFGILAELLAAAQNPACDLGDLAALYLEDCTVRWLKELVGYPVEGSMGLLVSGGSMASLVGLAVARQWCAEQDGWSIREDGLQGSRPRMVLYISDQGHSSMRKAAQLLGLGEASVRVLPTDNQFRLDPRRLLNAIRTDRSAGLRPFCVAGSAGTTNTGAVDPLAQVADVAHEYGLWFHVDGAYGSAAFALPEIRDRHPGLDQVDSLALDPHKWLSVPIECGCALVRDEGVMRRTFSLVPPYLQTEEGHGVGGPPAYAEYGFQQTRSFRALKLWMTLQQMGRQGVQELVRRHLELAGVLATAVQAAPELTIEAPVELSVVCFRYQPPGSSLDGASLDLLNKAIAETVQTEGRAFLTGTLLHGRFALRASVLHYATTASDVEHLVRTVLETGARLSAGADNGQQRVSTGGC